MQYPGLPLTLEDDIRLVEIQPGKYSDPICCSLLSTRLQKAAEYEALSYTWGDPLHKEPIFFQDSTNGTSHELLVTTNCVAALRQIRKLRGSRLVWIDAICIDQNEVDERNHQLGLMAQIYTQAKRVVIYLGESSNDSNSAMDWIRQIDSPALDISSPRTWFSPRERVIRPDTGMIESLLNRPWFNRVWVLQEAILCRSAIVQCGSKCISWDAFKQFKRFNTTTKWVETLPYVMRRPEITRNSEVAAEWQVMTELMEARQCEATDPRDKVYALIPLLSKSGIAMNILPNYSHSAAQVFTDVATYLITVIGLEVLCAVRGQSSLPGLPSWVPDWGIRSQRPTLGLFQSKRYWSKNHRYGAGGQFEIPSGNDSKTASPFTIDRIDQAGIASKQLKCRALPIGKITAIGDYCADSDDIPPIRQWKSIASHAIKASNGSTHSLRNEREDVGDIFVHTIVTGNVVYADVLEEAVDEFIKDDGNEPSRISIKEWMKGLPPSYRQQVQMILEACRGRRLLVTDTGLLGLAPLEAQSGDVIYVVPGVSVPLVMRRVEGRYSLVGECYVQNVMDGEAIEDMDDSKMENIAIV
jgi:hypothetical protein